MRAKLGRLCGRTARREVGGGKGWGIVIPQEEWVVSSMWKYVISWQNNIQGVSSAYLGAAGAKGSNLIRA